MTTEKDMRPDQVWDAIFGPDSIAGPFFQSALNLLMLIRPEEFSAAVNRISMETSVGPLLNPTAYLDGRRFDNARDYADVLNAAGQLRRVLERCAPSRGPLPSQASAEANHNG